MTDIDDDVLDAISAGYNLDDIDGANKAEVLASILDLYDLPWEPDEILSGDRVPKDVLSAILLAAASEKAEWADDSASAAAFNDALRLSPSRRETRRTTATADTTEDET